MAEKSMMSCSSSGIKEDMRTRNNQLLEARTECVVAELKENTYVGWEIVSTNNFGLLLQFPSYKTPLAVIDYRAVYSTPLDDYIFLLIL